MSKDMSVPTTPAAIQELAAKLLQAKNEYDSVQIKCGITGVSGSGKSSLINAIAGERIAKVNVVEQTTDPQEFHHGGIVFVDLPGVGTAKWPQESYVDRLGLEEYDCFILVTAHRFFEDDAYLYDQLSNQLNKPCFVVRNQFDLAIQQGRRDNGFSEEEVRDLIDGNIRQNLKPSQVDKVYITSAHYPQLYDFPRLIEDIVESQEGVKRTRLMADVAAWSEDMLVKKRAAAERLVGIYAGLSAANALNPVPGLDISVDLGMLLKMSNAVRHIYGLTQGQFDYTATMLDPAGPHTQAAKMLLSRMVAKYSTEKAIALLLEKFGRKVAIREVTKWAPFIGTIVAGMIGFKLTYSFGEMLLEDCESTARGFLEELKTKKPETV